MNGKAFTYLEIALLKDMFHRGASVADMAKRMNRSEPSVRTKLGKMGLSFSDRDAKHQNPSENVEKPTKCAAENVAEPTTEDTPKTIAEPAKQKTLNDFSPREIIRHMYKLGFRIRGGDLYQIVERKVLLNDIIA